MIIYKVRIKGTNAVVSIVDAPRSFAAYLKQIREANIPHEIDIEIHPADAADSERIRQRYEGR
jgi:hypothetical protein